MLVAVVHAIIICTGNRQAIQRRHLTGRNGECDFFLLSIDRNLQRGRVVQGLIRRTRSDLCRVDSDRIALRPRIGGLATVSIKLLLCVIGIENPGHIAIDERIVRGADAGRQTVSHRAGVQAGGNGVCDGLECLHQFSGIASVISILFLRCNAFAQERADSRAVILVAFCNKAKGVRFMYTVFFPTFFVSRTKADRIQFGGGSFQGRCRFHCSSICIRAANIAVAIGSPPI